VLSTFWTVIGILAIIAGFIQLLWYVGKFPAWISSRLGRVSWGRVRHGIEKIANEIRADDYRPEWVLGVGRTGTLIAALVAENMRWLPPEVRLATLNLRHGFTNGTRLREVTDESLKRQMHEAKVLLVDSEMYRGDTARFAWQTLTSWGAAEIKVAVLFKFEPKGYKLSEFDPHYVGETFSRPVMMPWLFTPEAKTVARKVQQSRWGK